MDTRIPQEEEGPLPAIETVATQDELDIIRYVAESAEVSRLLDIKRGIDNQLHPELVRDICESSWTFLRTTLSKSHEVIGDSAIYRTVSVIDEFFDLLIVQLTDKQNRSRGDSETS